MQHLPAEGGEGEGGDGEANTPITTKYPPRVGSPRTTWVRCRLVGVSSTAGNCAAGEWKGSATLPPLPSPPPPCCSALNDGGGVSSPLT